MTLRSSQGDAACTSPTVTATARPAAPLDLGEADSRASGPILVPRARSPPRRRHRHHACLLRPCAPPAPGGRGAIPGRRLPRRRVLGDLLQPAGRGAAAPGAGRHLGGLAHLEPDVLPQLVDRRASRRAPRGRRRGGAARPAHGRGPRHGEGHGRAARSRARWATPWTSCGPRPRSSRCAPTATAAAASAGPPRRPTRARSASASSSWRSRRPSHPLFDALTRWVASTLITLADLPFTFLPAGEDEG